MITDAASAAGSTAAAAANSQQKSDAATAASDFQNFLMLLTAQLRNQDPLSPLDSTQFVQQLASFSSVEQQIKTNSLLEAMASQFSGASLEGATAWIGKEVETQSGAAQFTGEPLAFRVPPGGPAGVREVVVTDPSGAVVYREAVPAGGADFNWDGKTSTGGTAPEGAYLVAVNYYEEGELADTKLPIAVTRVREARIENAEVALALENGAVVDPDAIIAVRNPSESE